MGRVLGFFQREEKTEDLSPGLIDLLIQLRESLRKDERWELADSVREGLKELGITLEDRPEGTIWKIT